MEGKHILGFLHYRTDLGDGMRSGVYFASCPGPCGAFCVPRLFLQEHPFGEEEREKPFYTVKELTKYLREEKLLCQSKELGISFLGKEPLADPDFVYEIALFVKETGMNLSASTCGNLPLWIYDKFFGVVDLFEFNVFSPFPGGGRKGVFPFGKEAMKSLLYLDEKHFPYRLRIFVTEENARSPKAFLPLVSSLKNVKSVILDFSHSGFSREEVTRFRSVFLERGIVLY